MADDVTPTDVTNTGETETPSTPSGTDETTSQTPVAEAAETVKENAEQSVPYSRFKEVNEKAKEVDVLKQKIAEMEAKLPKKPVDPQVQTVKDTLKPILDEMGYVSKEELARREQDKAIAQELSRLETKYNGTNGLPKFDRNKIVDFAINKQIADLDVAYKTLHEKEYLNWHIQQAMSKTQGVKSEASDGSGASTPGTTTDDVKTAALSGDRNALREYLKRVSFGK